MSNTKSTSKRETQTVNPADVGNAAEVMGFDTTAFVDLPIGFDPYWAPEVGAFVVANAEEFDARDPDFIRIRMRAAQPTKCAKGDVENAEEVIVPAGGYFTISTYAGIMKELLYHVKSGVKPVVKLIAEKKTKVRTGRWAGKDAWVFRMQASPADMAKLASGRADFMKELAPAPSREQPPTT